MPIIPDYEPYRGGEHRPSVASPRSAGLVGEANAGLGQDLAKAAENLGEIHRKVARVKKEGARNEADLIIGREVDGFDDFRNANSDESSWLPELQSRRERATREVARLGTDDAFKEELLQRVNLRFQAEEEKNTTVAMTEASRRARQSASGNVERLVAAGSYDAALEVVARGRAEEVFSTEEAEADTAALLLAKEEYGKKLRTAALVSEMDDDPRGVIARLESGNDDDGELEPAARASLLRHGQNLLARRREDEYRTLSHAIAGNGVTESELREVPQYLDDGAKQSLLAHARRTSPPDAAEQREGWRLLEGVSAAFARWSEGALGDAGYMDAFAAARQGIQATVPPGWSGRMMGALEAFSPERVIGTGGTAGEIVQAREKKRIEIRVKNLALRAQDEGLAAGDDPAMDDLFTWLDGESAPSMGDALERFQGGLSGKLAGTLARDLAGVLPGSSRAFFPPSPAAFADNTNLLDDGTGNA
jgi:hypothetical protein